MSLAKKNYGKKNEKSALFHEENHRSSCSAGRALTIGTGSMTKKSSVRSLLFSETDDIL